MWDPRTAKALLGLAEDGLAKATKEQDLRKIIRALEDYVWSSGENSSRLLALGTPDQVRIRIEELTAPRVVFGDPHKGKSDILLERCRRK